MTDSSKSIPNILGPRDQFDAATDALLRLSESTREFLKYQSVYVEAAQTKKTLALKEAELMEKDAKISDLETSITVFNRVGLKEVARLEGEKANVERGKSSVDSRLQQALEDKRRVEESAKNTKRSLDEQAGKAARLQEEALRLRSKEETLASLLKKEKEEKENLRNQLKMSQVEVEKYGAYIANLVDIDSKKFHGIMNKVWLHTRSLVKKYFSLDISTESEGQEHDTWIQQACAFLRLPLGTIQIPATNSSAAKIARQAVMLNVFALLFEQWIFTAAAPHLAQAGFDKILQELMDQDESKEALCRALLLSAPSAYASQGEELQPCVKWVVDAFGALFSPKTRPGFKTDVKSLLEVATNSWAESRSSRQKIIATLEYEQCPESFSDLSARGSHKHAQTVEDPDASHPDDDGDISFTAFPAIIAIGGGTRETIYQGFVIRYSHIHEAEIEWRQERGKRRFSRTGVPNVIQSLPPPRGAGGMTIR